MSSEDITSDDVKNVKTDSNVEKPKFNTEDLLKDLKDVREEAKNYRLKNKAISSEFDLFKMETEAKIKSFDEEKTALQSNIEKYRTMDKRIIEAELKAESVLAGIRDTDLIKMIDTSNIKMSDDGSVDKSSIINSINSLKESKPFLFGEDKKIQTSSNAKTNAKASDSKIDAMKMSNEEWNKEKARFLRG